MKNVVQKCAAMICLACAGICMLQGKAEGAAVCLMFSVANVIMAFS